MEETRTRRANAPWSRGLAPCAVTILITTRLSFDCTTCTTFRFIKQSSSDKREGGDI